MINNVLRSKVLLLICLLIVDLSIPIGIKNYVNEKTADGKMYKSFLNASISVLSATNNEKSTNNKYGFTKSVLISAMPSLYLKDETENEAVILKEKDEISDETGNKPMNSSTSAKEMGDKPLVLIYHTHATESYKDKTSKGTYRSRNKDENMVSVGEEMVKVLENEYGIKCIHDETLHDYPSYNAAYDNSLFSAKKILKKYPSIRYVFDIHRDGLPSNNNNARYNGKINGKNVANIMIVLGLNHSKSKQNLDFANEVKNKSDSMYPSLCLNVEKRYQYRYNQWLRGKSILLEIGSNLNSLQEAKKSSSLMGKVIGQIITKDMNK